MGTGCIRCKISYDSASLACPICGFFNPDKCSWLPYDLVERCITRFSTQKSNLTDDEIKDLFVNSLQELDVQFNKITINNTINEGVFDIKVDASRNITLGYFPAIASTFDKDEIDAMLKHETCHFVTIPTSTEIMVPQAQPAMVEFLSTITECYDEFTANLE